MPDVAVHRHCLAKTGTIFPWCGWEHHTSRWRDETIEQITQGKCNCDRVSRLWLKLEWGYLHRITTYRWCCECTYFRIVEYQAQDVRHNNLWTIHGHSYSSCFSQRIQETTTCCNYIGFTIQVTERSCHPSFRLLFQMSLEIIVPHIRKYPWIGKLMSDLIHTRNKRLLDPF